MDALLAISFLVGLATVIDIFRRPQLEWVKADRNRGYWKFLAILLGLFGMGLIVGVAYAILVLPRFGSSGPSTSDDYSNDDFRRQ